MFPDKHDTLNDQVFKDEHYLQESPPTPREMFRSIGIVLAVTLYMAATISLLVALSRWMG